MIFLLIGCAAAVAGVVYSSFFEWVLHKYLMHSDRFMKYPHRAHQLEHHGIFRADATYFLTEGIHSKEDETHLTFAWWNAPLLIGLHAPIGVAIFLWAGGWPAVLGSALGMIGYYAMYEYIHYCMHVLKGRPFERTRFFQFIQTHHRLHHVYFQKNLNVVLPIADTILGTRITLKDAALFERLEGVRQKRIERAKKSASTARA